MGTALEYDDCRTRDYVEIPICVGVNKQIDITRWRIHNGASQKVWRMYKDHVLREYMLSV